MDFKDKVVIITGAGQNIGKLYAEDFARAGAKVTACDIVDCSETEKSIKSMGGEVLTLRTDITNEKDTTEMAKKTVERFGEIDILVNNAAIWGGIALKPFYETSVEEWDKMMAVNLKGMFLCCKAVFPYMKKQQRGKIVNIASVAVLFAPPFTLHYNTSKGGVVVLTRTMARELGEFNINVNCVAPGLVWNEPSKGQIPEEEFKRDISTRCLKRAQQPEDLLGAVMFFSSKYSDFVTGQTLVVDGGSIMH
jgi:NAD(P)-dependent dehydrogenase (short-subunit alcohol dehydrogenase family)